jgi:hypothetical protein
MTRPSLAIVVSYFGEAPLWLPAFLLSCRHNPDVQWLLYTDFAVPVPLPANVTLTHMDIRELRRRSSAVFGTRIAITHRRKVNDLKPAYGLIFADDLAPFDFWAYSDLDIVWGDVRRFVTDDLLEHHDIVSARSDRVCGHFTLFRNTAPINRTLELIPDVAQAMAGPSYLRLDERELTQHLRDHLRQAHRARLPASPRVFWQADWTIDTAYQKAMGDRPSDRLWWRDGRTFDAEGRELMYLHFHKLKNDMKAIDFGFDDAPAAFSIGRRGVGSRQ